MSPSGKAVGSGPTIQGFESLHPSQAILGMAHKKIGFVLRIESLHPSQEARSLNRAYYKAKKIMKKITDFIVNHCYVIFVAFLAVTGICGILATKVNINKDIYAYMPADSETALGLEIMNDEFDYDKTSSYKMMLKDVPDSEKASIKADIESVEGVDIVDWEDTEEYNRDGYTLYHIHIGAPADSEAANNAYQEIHRKYSEIYETAEAGQVYDFNGEVLKIPVAIFAVACAMVILIIMSKSWVEPFLFLFAILLAVVVNKGTNIIFPSVSHITDAISAILQMALSMDYAIMLSTRYRQERANCENKREAMRNAMQYSFGAICSSSVTTVVGLIVLVLMSFTIGRDMGLVLSKGVILSLLSIFTSLPALLLIFDKAIKKTAKKTINFKMAWLGRASYKLRHFAFPIFLAIFVGSFLLKGNTVIDYTSSQNNKIKDIFNEPNQIALVYDGKLDEQMTEFCKKYDAREDTVRVLCYGNTINEPEKYYELVSKINSLSDDKVDTKNYLIKAIYYQYYKNANNLNISLDDFVKFLQRDVFSNEDFANEVTDEIKNKVNRFAYFTDQNEVNKPRSKTEIASILGVGANKLDDVFVLWTAEKGSTTKLTLYDFAKFVTEEVATNPEYASMITASQRSSLKSLLLFSDSGVTDVAKSPRELAKLFGIDQNVIEQILVYYNYKTVETPTVSVSVANLIDFALTDENILAELSLTKDQANAIKSGLERVREMAIEHGIDLSILNKEYSYADVETAVSTIRELLDGETEWLDLLDEKMSQLENVYRLYQAETTAKYTKTTPRALVDFLLTHAEDDKLSSAMTADTTSKLQLVKYIMDHQSTRYSYQDLAQTFSLDQDKLKLVYALYEYRHIDTNPQVSLWNLMNFINDEILPNEEYASRLTADEINELATVTTLMRSVRNGALYNYDSLYRAILPVSHNLEKNKIFLAYLYYGSLYDYDENWTLTVEKFVNYLVDTILPDSRFEARIEDEIRQKIADGKTTIDDAKNLLVGPKHYRALIESNLPLEGNETFNFIGELKSNLGSNNKIDYFLVGDSAMAYEMSQSFMGEMDMITIITMLAIFAVVVCTFKSFFVSLLLVCVIQCAVYIVMAYLSFTGSSIYFIALIIVQAILMGATIDYAILYTSYYVENRTENKLGVKEALISTYSKSISAILTSASILTLVTAVVGNFTSAIAGKICQSISLGTFCATIIIIFLLPALLATLDRFIIKKKRLR